MYRRKWEKRQYFVVISVHENGNSFEDEWTTNRTDAREFASRVISEHLIAGRDVKKVLILHVQPIWTWAAK